MIILLHTIWPFEFNKLPLGISVGCQGLSRVIDDLFPNLKGKFFLTFFR